jgi:hypothetical protein
VSPVSPVDFELNLPIKPEWHNVELLRVTLQTCLAFRHEHARDAVALTVGELLENAVKYGNWTDPKASIGLRVQGARDQVLVEVSNPVPSDDRLLATLFEAIRELKAYPSPLEAYCSRLKAHGAGEATGGSQLGLARILYEANADLWADCQQGLVCVHAQLPTGEG